MRTIIIAGFGLLLASCGPGTSDGVAQSAAPDAAPSGQAGEIAATPDGDGRVYAARGFTGVGLSGPDSVAVTVGPDFAVRATGDVAVLDALVVRLDRDMLRIGRRPGSNIRGSARVAVSLPSLVAGSLSGSGDMAIGAMEGTALSLATSGSGDIDVERVALSGSIDANIAGSGSIEVSGRARAANVSVMGSGDFDGDELTVEQSQVSVMGSGDVDLRVTGAANLSSMGSGDITVTGTQRCTVSRAGSGQIRCQ